LEKGFDPRAAFDLSAPSRVSIATSKKFLALGALLCATLLIGCDPPPPAAAGARGALVDEVLAGVALRDQDDRPLSPSLLRDKTVLVSFMFTSCPTVCPVQTHDLAEVVAALPEAVRARLHLLSISVDPAHDTPAALKRFAEANGARLDGWSFVTASRADTDRLTARIGVFDRRLGAGEPGAHGTSIYVFDAQGRPVQRYAGSPVDRPRLVRELQQIDARRAAQHLTAN
jgi:protein SCO1